MSLLVKIGRVEKAIEIGVFTVLGACGGARPPRARRAAGRRRGRADDEGRAGVLGKAGVSHKIREHAAESARDETSSSSSTWRSSTRTSAATSRVVIYIIYIIHVYTCIHVCIRSGGMYITTLATSTTNMPAAHQAGGGMILVDNLLWYGRVVETPRTRTR